MYSNFLENPNRRFLIFSLFILLPWVFVFFVRYVGPITHPSISMEMITFFIFVLFFTYMAFVIGYVSGYVRRPQEHTTHFSQNSIQTQAAVGKVFYSVRTVVIFMAILYPVISFIDFFLVKGASLSTIVEQREAEHLTGPRNSLIGAVGALLSGSPPILLVMLGVAKFKKRSVNYILLTFVILGFFSMFLSGGRNAFFISLIFVMFYSLFFSFREKVIKQKMSLSKIFSYLFVFYCIFFSMKMFLDRFEAQGFDVSFMLDYLESEYDILIYRPDFTGNLFTSLYSIFVYLSFYISHSFTYLNDYFVLSYSPYMGGGYNFPQVARLIDIAAGTDFFSAGRDRMILAGVYLTLPGSLYLDFGIAGTLGICLLLGFAYGHLSYHLATLALYQKLLLTYLSVAFVFSPIYGVFGMANGFSLIFILLFAVFRSIKIRH